MSYQSVKTAVANLIQAEVPGVAYVKDRNQLDTLWPPLSLMPLVLMRYRHHSLKTLAIGAHNAEWYLDMMLWAAYAPEQDQEPFDTLVQQIETMILRHTTAGATANDSQFNTTLYSFGIADLQIDDKPAFSANGMMYRHCLISPLVTEWITHQFGVA